MVDIAKAQICMLAPNFDNVDNLTPLYEYDSRYFQIYRKYMDSTWFVSEGSEPSAADRDKPINLPYTIWKFKLITQPEMQFFKYTFSLGALTDVKVTVRTYDAYNDFWGNYNGIMKFNTDVSTYWNPIGQWDDVEIKIKDLKLITS